MLPVVVTDIAADTTTTAAVAVGGSATGEIETAGDKDWFEVELEAGRTYRFDLQGAPGGHGTLSDRTFEVLEAGRTYRFDAGRAGRAPRSRTPSCGASWMPRATRAPATGSTGPTTTTSRARATAG